MVIHEYIVPGIKQIGTLTVPIWAPCLACGPFGSSSLDPSGPLQYDRGRLSFQTCSGGREWIPISSISSLPTNESPKRHGLQAGTPGLAFRVFPRRASRKLGGIQRLPLP